MVYMLSLELFESKINIVHHTLVFSLLAKDKKKKRLGMGKQSSIYIGCY